MKAQKFVLFSIALASNLPMNAEAAVQSAPESKTNYVSSAETEEIRDRSGLAAADMFAVSYLERTADKDRPVAFFFDGGPGSSSRSLLLAYGPKTASRDLSVRAVSLSDNEKSLLSAADLVFVDPIGTGYSMARAGHLASEFWETEADARAFAQFINQWLEKHGRRNAPVYLVGRSYGGMRAVAIAHVLTQDGGSHLKLAGLALLSPLTFNLATEQPIRQYVASIPTYAVIAAAQQRGSHRSLSRDEIVAQSTAFAHGPYKRALDAGVKLSRPELERVARELSSWIGLPAHYIIDKKLRIAFDDVRVQLLAGEHKTLGQHDGRTSEPVRKGGDQGSWNDPAFSRIDPVNEKLSALVLESVNYQNVAGLYKNFVMDAAMNWDWKNSTLFRDGSGAALREVFQRCPNLEILVTSGFYDLTIPFRVPVADFAAAQIPSSHLRDRIYPTGHFMSEDPEGHALEAADLGNFINKVRDAGCVTSK